MQPSTLKTFSREQQVTHKATHSNPVNEQDFFKRADYFLKSKLTLAVSLASITSLMSVASLRVQQSFPPHTILSFVSHCSCIFALGFPSPLSRQNECIPLLLWEPKMDQYRQPTTRKLRNGQNDKLEQSYHLCAKYNFILQKTIPRAKRRDRDRRAFFRSTRTAPEKADRLRTRQLCALFGRVCINLAKDSPEYVNSLLPSGDQFLPRSRGESILMMQLYRDPGSVSGIGCYLRVKTSLKTKQ